MVTVRDIMKACGLTQGALYNHFKSKDELLHDIITSTQAELERHLPAGGGGGGRRSARPAGGLRARLRRCATAGCASRRWSPIARSAGSTAERVSDIRRSRRAIRDILVGILTEGIEKGVFDPPQIDGRRDLKAMAMALLDQCTHVSMWYVPGRRLERGADGEALRRDGVALGGREAAN